MRFRGRYLQGNESTRFPSSVLVFDTETLPTAVPNAPHKQLHRLRLWAARHWRFEKGRQTRVSVSNGWESQEFWRYLYSHTNPYKPLYCFAHNVGFDLTTLRFWRELDAGRLTLEQPLGWRGNDEDTQEGKRRLGILCLTDPPTIIECWIPGTRKRIVFLDTRNYFRCSLDELGEEVGLLKMEMPGWDQPDSDWFRYCMTDVNILEQVVLLLERFVREHDCGVFKFTIGSQAMASFKHAHMKHRIVLHREEYPLELEREAYRGGEVRLGFCGTVVARSGGIADATADDTMDNLPARLGPVYVLDCQSFYPSVMLGNEFPCELVGSIVGPSIPTLERFSERFFAVAEVGVETAEETYPTKVNGVSLNAVGRFTTALCGPELQDAIRLGHITSVGRMNWYKKAKLFDSFVNYWFEQRKAARAAGQKETEMMIKSLMNSLFGKFGQRKERWLDDGSTQPISPWGQFWQWSEATKEFEWFRSVCWRVQRNSYGGEANESFPAIAAAVTSYGRQRMGLIRRFAGKGNWYYQDTDSLHCNEQGYNNLVRANFVESGAVGKLKLLDVYQTAEYRGIKDYTIDGVRVIAGIKRSAVEVERDIYTQLEFQRLSSILSNVPHDGVVVTEKLIEHSHSLPPGRVLSDGTVLPPVLG